MKRSLVAVAIIATIFTGCEKIDPKTGRYQLQITQDGRVLRIDTLAGDVYSLGTDSFC